MLDEENPTIIGCDTCKKKTETNAGLTQAVWVRGVAKKLGWHRRLVREGAWKCYIDVCPECEQSEKYKTYTVF